MNNFRKKFKGRAGGERGFILFIAVVISAILVLVSFFVSNIATKEIALSTINRESGQAIFAANAGIECALYWDAKYGSYPTYTSAFATSTAGSITCNGTTVSGGQAIAGTSSISRIGGGGNANPTSVFGFSLHSSQSQSNACVVVSVNKTYPGFPNVLTTYIYSYGYNNCNTSDPRRVERGIFVRY